LPGLRIPRDWGGRWVCKPQLKRQTPRAEDMTSEGGIVLKLIMGIVDFREWL
jgi:hypothetical protein